ncbi:uncharacterized protein LOC141857089 isoform X2 [Brevipalpus obovatus]|uniref:uncharacterized protein LOC141857089 isoform X2 n=1 Tax=Brevipalpus obovatus TaxID=246614 RepID=UPI003D9F1139
MISDQCAMDQIVPGKSRNLIETIPRPIHQAETKHLIASMAPGEVLRVSIRPEKFQSIDSDFMAVVREGSSMNLFFYLDSFEREVLTVLQDHYRKSPSSIQAIPVEDSLDFLQLAMKSGCGAGGRPKRNTGATTTYVNLLAFFKDLHKKSHLFSSGDLRVYYSPWLSLSADKIKRAFEEIPEQITEEGCGANSAARAFELAGVEFKYDYSCWEENCPRNIDTILEKQSLPTCILGCASAVALAPFTAGGSVACLGLVALSQTLTRLSANRIITSNPSPWELAEFINKHIPSSKKAIVRTYFGFQDCAKAICSDIYCEDPVIAFILWGPTDWHYANVIAVNSDRSEVKGFMILETGPVEDFSQNSCIEYRTYANMKHIMYNPYKFNSAFCVGGTPDNFTIIRFVDT